MHEEVAQDRLGLLVYQLTCLVLAAGGAFVSWTAVGMSFYGAMGPGPGFFPLLIGLLILGTSAALLFVSLVRAAPPAPGAFAIPRGPLVDMTLTVGMVAFFALMIERIGFAFTMFVVLLVLLLHNRCRLVPTALAVAAVGSFGVGYVFVRWLGVTLPAAPYGLLQGILL